MAKVINGFLGDAIGKLGNVVFRKWNSLITAAQYQPNVKNPNSIKQQLQRAKIKNLSLALLPFNDSLIPLNFKNKKGFSTSWAEAIKANYPLTDEAGNISFASLKLSGGVLVPPVILEANLNPYINQLQVKYKLVNKSELNLGLLRLTAVGKMILDDTYNTENICKLPLNDTFVTYIDELDLPDWPLNFDFDNAWSEGFLFYNLVSAKYLDVRAYNPKNIVNKASAGVYYGYDLSEFKYIFDTSTRLLMPSNIHAEILQNESAYELKIFIDDNSGFPGLLPEDVVVVSPAILEQNANKYNGGYSFAVGTGFVTIPLLPGDETKPFNIIYFVTSSDELIKSTATRFDFNHPKNITYSELLFKNDFINGDSVKIHKPFTAIWGDLKDFIPLELIGTIPYTISSKNEGTGEIKEHVFNSKYSFLCSKLVRNQLYTISISDSSGVAATFSVIGIDGDYNLSLSPAVVKTAFIFKSDSDLAFKVF